ncbi:MAG: hypothetical protein ACI9J3_001317 [Parvicellaceae bacterium]
MSNLLKLNPPDKIAMFSDRLAIREQIQIAERNMTKGLNKLIIHIAKC